MTKVKGVGRRRRQLLDDLRNIRRYWELKEEAEDRNRWNQQFINRKQGGNNIFHKSMDLIITSILKNNNNNNTVINNILIGINILQYSLLFLQKLRTGKALCRIASLAYYNGLICGIKDTKSTQRFRDYVREAPSSM